MRKNSKNVSHQDAWEKVENFPVKKIFPDQFALFAKEHQCKALKGKAEEVPGKMPGRLR